MKKLICLIPLLMFAISCSAATVTFLWDYPVANEPDLTGGGFKLYQRRQSTATYPGTAAATVTPALRTVTITTAPGKYCWQVTAFNPDTESGPTNEVCADVKPNAPTNLRIP